MMFLTLRRFLFNPLGDMFPSSCFAWRRFILRLMGVRVAKSSRVNAGFRVYGSGELLIEENVWIGRNCHFYTIGRARIKIGSNTEIAPECVFNSQSHHVGTAEHRAGECIHHDISVGSGVWIGTRSVILCEQIGNGAVIGAGAVVLSRVAENTLSAGIPAAEKKTLP